MSRLYVFVISSVLSRTPENYARGETWDEYPPYLSPCSYITTTTYEQLRLLTDHGRKQQ